MGELTTCWREKEMGLLIKVSRHYVTPMEPGYSVEMKPESMDMYSFPGTDGSWWKSEEARPILEGVKI